MSFLKRFDMSPLPFYMFYVFCFMAAASFFTFINVYFFHQGFTMAQVGVLAALGPLISLVSQPFWGILSDRFDKRLILIIVLLGATIMSFVIPLSSAFSFLIVVMLIYSSFGTSAIPLGDAITLLFIEGNKSVKYSSIRVVGALTFGLFSIVVGWLVHGEINRIFYINAFFLALTALMVFFMPVQKKERAQEETNAEPIVKESLIKQIVKLLKNKVVLCIYLSSFVFGLSLSFLFAYLGIRLTEIGADETQLGISMFIAAFSEIPILLLADKFFRKKRPEYLLMFSAAFLSLRLFIMFISSSVILIFFAQATQGISFVLHLYFCVILLHENAPAHLKSTAQTLSAMIRMGMGALLGNLGGGFLAQNIGLQNVFLILSIFVFSTCVFLPAVLILLHRFKSRRKLYETDNQS